MTLSRLDRLCSSCFSACRFLLILLFYQFFQTLPLFTARKNIYEETKHNQFHVNLQFYQVYTGPYVRPSGVTRVDDIWEHVVVGSGVVAGVAGGPWPTQRWF